MIQLIYASTATVLFSSGDLRALLARTRERNATAGVTGMLLHVSGAFMQVLEGDSEIVHALYARIRRDRRHARVVTLRIGDLDERTFAESMEFFDGTGRASMVTGYRSATGFSHLATDPETALQIVDEVRGDRWCARAA